MDKDLLELIKNGFMNIEDYLNVLKDHKEEIFEDAKNIDIIIDNFHDND